MSNDVQSKYKVILGMARIGITYNSGVVNLWGKLIIRSNRTDPGKVLISFVPYGDKKRAFNGFSKCIMRHKLLQQPITGYCYCTDDGKICNTDLMDFNGLLEWGNLSK